MNLSPDQRWARGAHFLVVPLPCAVPNGKYVEYNCRVPSGRRREEKR